MRMKSLNLILVHRPISCGRVQTIMSLGIAQNPNMNLLVLVQAENTIGMYEIIRPWVC